MNLRLFHCFDDIGKRDALLDELAKVTKEDPEATCDDVEEIQA